MDLVHDPAHSAHANPHDPPLREDLPWLPYRNFYCALEDLVASYTLAISYSIHRSSIKIGTSSRSMYNFSTYFRCLSCNMSTQGVTVYVSDTWYMWEHFWNMSNARGLAEQHIWAAVTAHEKNQTFNCTNENVFVWKCMEGNMRGLWCWICTVWWVWFRGDDETESESVGWNSGTTWALQHQQIGRDYLFWGTD